jgi:hypothetical protein
VLEVHERPFVQAFAEILKNFDPSTVIDWLAGKQARQAIPLEVLWLLVHSCREGYARSKGAVHALAIAESSHSEGKGQ